MQGKSKSNARKKNGHNRRPSYGKIMPISSLIDNSMNSSLHQSTAAQPTSRDWRTIERSDADRPESIADLTTNFIQHERSIEKTKERTATEIINLNKTFLKFFYHLHDKNSGSKCVDITASRNDDKNDTDRIIGSNEPNIMNKEKTLTGNQSFDFQPLSGLCENLSDGSCTSMKTCQSTDDMSHLSFEPDFVTIKLQNKDDTKFPTKAILLGSNGNRYEFLTSMLQKSANDGSRNSASMETNTSYNKSCVPLTIENLKQFNKKVLLGKLAITGTLASTSAMTSPAVHRRLAARNIELSLNRPEFVYDVENAEYIPPKDLLMYLLR